MIKINLATRKQSSVAGGPGGGGAKAGGLAGILSGLRSGGGGSAASALSGLPIRKIAIPLIACFLAGSILDNYKEEEMKKADEVVAKVTAENNKLKTELSKYKGYDELKKQLDGDEFSIRTKLETIKKLINDRASPPKVLLSLAVAIPKEVWLSEFSIQDSKIIFKGSSLGYTQISDFMKALDESVYFTDVGLRETQLVRDDKGASRDLDTFELYARRR